jgi:hypothetical protein
MNKLNIGDFVKYRSHRGQIIDMIEPSICPYTGSPEPGSITIEREDGYEFMDYHYVFELDIEKMRDYKLKSIGI